MVGYKSMVAYSSAVETELNQHKVQGTPIDSFVYLQGRLGLEQFGVNPLLPARDGFPITGHRESEVGIVPHKLIEAINPDLVARYRSEIFQGLPSTSSRNPRVLYGTTVLIEDRDLGLMGLLTAKVQRQDNTVADFSALFPLASSPRVSHLTKFTRQALKNLLPLLEKVTDLAIYEQGFRVLDGTEAVLRDSQLRLL